MTENAPAAGWKNMTTREWCIPIGTPRDAQPQRDDRGLRTLQRTDREALMSFPRTGDRVMT